MQSCDLQIQNNPLFSQLLTKDIDNGAYFAGKILCKQ